MIKIIIIVKIVIIVIIDNDHDNDNDEDNDNDNDNNTNTNIDNNNSNNDDDGDGDGDDNEDDKSLTCHTQSTENLRQIWHNELIHTVHKGGYILFLMPFNINILKNITIIKESNFDCVSSQISIINI